MFKFLKDKLKKAISKFSNDVEEEASKQEPEQTQEQPKEEPKEENKEETEKQKTEHAAAKSQEQGKEEDTGTVPEAVEHEKPADKEQTPDAETTLDWTPPVDKQVKEAKKEAVDETAEQKTSQYPAEKINGVKITYFVHGTTTDNERDIATGQKPGKLSSLGKEQAKELGKIETRFDAVFCSDLKRAVDSAQLAFARYKIIQDKRLREADYGEMTQKPAAVFKSHMEDYIKKPFPSGESLIDVQDRIAEFLNDLYDDYYGKHIAVVAHQAPQLAMEVLLNNKTWEQAIKDDWRLGGSWQPGWEYMLTHELKIDDNNTRKDKSPEAVIDIERPEHIKPVQKPVDDAAEDEAETEEKAEPKKGIFSIIKDRVTKKSLAEERFNDLFWNLEIALMENNVAMDVIEKIKNDLKERLVNTRLTIGKTQDIIKESLEKSIEELFAPDNIQIIQEIRKKKPYVILFVGVNGAGKTTTIAKLARLLQKNGLSCVMAASDTFRAAAIQQLEEHANRLKVRLIKHDYGSDPAAVAFDAIKYASARNIDAVLIDTAGRQHSNTNLMEELRKIVRVAKPDLKIFIGESITGNDCVEQANQFNDAIGIDAIILSKADVDEKGGAAISISYVTKKPILYIGTGQEYDSLKEFDKDIVTRNLGLA